MIVSLSLPVGCALRCRATRLCRRRLSGVLVCSRNKSGSFSGGGVGPDLSGAGSKYTRRDLLESLLEPSKVISDQYQNVLVTRKDDEDVTGIIVEDTDSKLVLVVNGLTGTKVEVKKSDTLSAVALTKAFLPST